MMTHGALDNPLVSVIIPCYQAKDYVERSIQSAFGQSYQPIEVIVVDDGSTDGSLELLAQLRRDRFPALKVLTHENRINLGVSATRHRGLQAAAGEYIALLDADDEFEPDKLEKQMAVLVSNPSIIMCHTAASIIGDQTNAPDVQKEFTRYPDQPYRIRQLKGYLKQNGICTSSVVVRTEALRRVPFATPQLFQYEDWMCWVLLGAYGKFILLNEQLTRYRVHSSSSTASVHGNPLKGYYSTLEFKLAVAARSESSIHCLRCVLSAGISLAKIVGAYLVRPGYPAIDSGYRLNLLSKVALRVFRAVQRARNTSVR